MKDLIKKNVIFRLISGVLSLFVVLLTIYFFIKLLEINNDNIYIINLVGLGGIGMFAILETVLLFKNIKKILIFHSVIFNEHNSTINWPAFIVANVGLGIGLIITIISVILLNTNANADIYTSTMVLIPLGVFILINALIYDAYTYFYKAKKLKVKDLIK